ncbi:U32 family peptidase [Crassaminicella thermophila]|uniref:U32 family peptidase n=1 Tax=Crassaminicella thermophila TaxID=2599308 RepID=A0A5C0SGF9_CRATE|nr:U32 family peptidase [Crassaminicella thermophila]QEK12484.1 U32 family peptidase [Crassaminicella thermophila]
MSIELLAPVGSFEALKAAVQNGADAVYLGGKLFSARQYAKNFDDDELIEAVNYCHIRGVKVFVTVNTLVSNKELVELGKYLAFLYNIDVDAIIVQDLGVAKFIREYFPNFELHASTQMFVHNFEGVKLLEAMGFKRVVLAREMSKEEIFKVKKNTQLDIEVFVHGALCISYSGQCLMSSMIGGRSGNRGRCAQPCRKQYTLIDMDRGKKIKNNLGDYLLSPRDLNTLENLNEILDTGIKSLKIEGRMKRPEYVATVVKAYRKAIDQYMLYKSRPQIDSKTLKDVKQMFNRRFTKGYILGEVGKNIMSFEKPSNRGIKIGKVIDYDKNKKRVKIKLEDYLSKGDGLEIWSKDNHKGAIVENIFQKGQKKNTANPGEVIEINFKHSVFKDSFVYKTSDVALLKEAKESYERKDKNIPLYGKFKGKLGSKIELCIWDEDGNYIHEKGDIVVQKALKTATKKERIYEQISKLGKTPYQLKKLEIELDESVAIPIGEINGLRRKAIERLNKLRQNHNNRKLIDLERFQKKMESLFNNKKLEKTKDVRISVSVNNIKQLKAVLNFDIDRIYYSDFSTIEEALKIAKTYNKSLFLAFSRITEDEELKSIKKKINMLTNMDGILASNLGVLNIMKDFKNLNIVTDFSFNVFNNGAIEFLKDMNVDEITLSLELTLKQIREIIKRADTLCEVIIHGSLPLMISKYCPVSTFVSDGKKHCGACKKTQFGLKDQLGIVFPIISDENCKIQILNAQKLCLIEHIKELIDSKITNFRIQFMLEDEEEVKNTLKAYLEAIENTLKGKRIESKTIKSFINKMKEEGITKGHFFRGVM